MPVFVYFCSLRKLLEGCNFYFAKGNPCTIDGKSQARGEFGCQIFFSFLFSFFFRGVGGWCQHTLFNYAEQNPQHLQPCQIDTSSATHPFLVIFCSYSGVQMCLVLLEIRNLTVHSARNGLQQPSKQGARSQLKLERFGLNDLPPSASHSVDLGLHWSGLA